MPNIEPGDGDCMFNLVGAPVRNLAQIAQEVAAGQGAFAKNNL